jgi:pimeloyl-ACP methyl ester carboxylesterase
VKDFLDLGPGLRLRYRRDDYTDPWRTPQTVVCVHGFGESGAGWRAWVPHLARDFRVLRIDQRGFGESSAMPEDFDWSLDVLTGDLEHVVRALGNGPVHLIGAKIAGPVVMRFAATRPHLARSVTVVGSMARGPQDTRASVQHFVEHGIESWARTSMGARLGSRLPPEAVEWWIKLTCRTPRSTILGLLPRASGIDVTADLPNIRCPVLVITTDSKRRPVSSTREWQSLLASSELVALPGDAYHPAASDPDTCARVTADFLKRISAA